VRANRNGYCSMVYRGLRLTRFMGNRACRDVACIRTESHMEENMNARTFDTRTLAGLKAAERYQAWLYNRFDKVTVTAIGLYRVRISGLTPKHK
jgi:hypothetical protein